MPPTISTRAGLPRALTPTLTLSLLAVTLALPAGALAEEQTSPAPPGPFTLPFAPPPELCTLPPRDIADYEAVMGTPQPTDLPSVEITAGAPADAATVEGVTATMVQIFACLNAGDYLRLAGAYTDEGFLEDNGSNGLTQEVIDFIKQPPTPVAEADRDVLYGVYAVQVLADGRVAAIMQRGIEGRGGVNLMLFRQVNDRWLVDLWLDEPFVILPDFSFQPGAEEATPAT
ncbi:MAG: hypothetical protein QM692_21395 [Thermomicrobiales bacterium]